MQSTLLVYLLQILFFFCLSCSNSDLRNPNTLEQAKIEAIEISQIKKEFMYGMMWLYVDEDNDVGKFVNDNLLDIPNIERSLTTLTFKAF